VNDPIVVK